MDGQQGSQEASRRAQEWSQEAANETRRLSSQAAEIRAQTVGVWMDVNQRVAHDLIETTSAAVQESMRLMMELQRAQVEALTEAQVAAFRWTLIWPQAFSDPMHWYQRTMEEVLEIGRRAMRVGRRNVDTMSHAVDRLQSSTEQAARTVENAFNQAAAKIQDFQTQAERLRAA